jgi:TetR/AcrR family transcriptional regulator, transcriptional repressor for nem operon
MLSMPRPRSQTTDSVIDASMRHFWQRGYHATSMDELVDAIGVSRHAIYTSVGGKRELYRLGFTAYQRLVVSPAFARVEQPIAGLNAIADFFEHQIAQAETAGLPGPGCLVANAATETAPHDAQIACEVAAHHARLKTGFIHALGNEPSLLSSTEIDALAEFLVTSAQGLWSMSRTVASATPLRAHAAILLSLLKTRLFP